MLFDKKFEGNDPIYQKACDSSYPDKEMQKLEDLWVQFKPYADKGFEQLFRDDLVSRFWEMYLGVMLLQEKKVLEKESDDGPDICVLENKKKRIWIEATAPNKGKGKDKLEEMEKTFWIPEEKILLRIRSAIEDKYRKYCDYLEKGRINKSDTYIIAINASKLGFPDVYKYPPYIIKSVFPIGPPFARISLNSGNIVGMGHHHREYIKKESGSQVETKIFFNEKYSVISAIIYSEVKPFYYDSNLGSQIEIVHNPNATNPIKKGWLKTGIEYCFESDLFNFTNWNLIKKN
jgi:type I restriction enzyme S subunit